MSVDDTLAAWAATIHLSDATASEIYQTIVATPAHLPSPGLDPGWWRSFAADFTTRMITSSQLTPWAA